MGWVSCGVRAFLAVGPIMAAGTQADEPMTPDPNRAIHSSGPENGAAQLAEGVVGRLVASSGRPLAGARIVAQSLDDPSGPIPEIAILSDAGGRFVWPLRAGRYRLAAVVDGQEIAAADLVVRPAQVTTLDLRAQQ